RLLQGYIAYLKEKRAEAAKQKNLEVRGRLDKVIGELSGMAPLAKKIGDAQDRLARLLPPPPLWPPFLPWPPWSRLEADLAALRNQLTKIADRLDDADLDALRKKLKNLEDRLKKLE